MPIYAYRCAACGHSRDVLQKMSDAQLTVCPACGAEQFQKQVTAAGFQLKGSGWYATDFRGGNSGAPAPAAAGTPAAPAAGDSSSGSPSSGGGESSSGGGTSASASSPSTACGGSCACH
ncbi:MAG TPA: FmdB family zinc ribbon protein [Ideonella sp.]|uniref:FmdB family zinc ribbon protein n=1 Tax=Ideonella sp. TaxID=1929293 RepID=UPI002C4E1DF8|nr:FmdB family zinc ribbon protein [Ideonella sp.]HSI50910.1 FmdB family zinc ribbon protein [Ideonella sp.]